MPAAGQHKMEPRARLKCHQAWLLTDRGCRVAGSVVRGAQVGNPAVLDHPARQPDFHAESGERGQDEVAPDLVAALRARRRTAGRSAGRDRARSEAATRVPASRPGRARAGEDPTRGRSAATVANAEPPGGSGRWIW